MIDKQSLTEIGKFQRPHALKGELNAILDIDPDYFLEAAEGAMIVEMEGLPVPFFAETIRTKGSTSYLVKLQDVDSEEEAREFVNKTIYVETEKAREFLMETDEFYDMETVAARGLIGYEVRDEADKKIGTVLDVDTTTLNTLLIVGNEEGGNFMIPINELSLRDMDEEKRILWIEIPEGLLDLNN